MGFVIGESRSLAPTFGSAIVKRRGAYALDIAGRPASWLVISIAFGAVITQVTVLAALMVLVVAVLAIWLAAGQPRVQRAIETRRLDHERVVRRCRRENRLQNANVPIHELRHLGNLVTQIACSSPVDVDHFELDALLDRYADLAVTNARCEDAMRTLDRAQIKRSLETISTDASRASRRSVLDHQLACWRRDEQVAEHCREEMLAISELVKLIALRTASPDDVLDTGDVERRLAQLDDEDAARLELGA